MIGSVAMRLCGPGVLGEPLDRPGAKRVLMRAVELGITPERRLREIEHSGVKEQAGLLLIFTCSRARSVIRMISSPCSRRSAPMEQRYACGCRRSSIALTRPARQASSAQSTKFEMVINTTAIGIRIAKRDPYTGSAEERQIILI